MNKRVLLFLSCLLLVSVSGCGSSSTTTLAPNGFLYAANSFRSGSMSGFTVTSGALARITGTPFATTGDAPYTLAAVSTKFLYAGIPTTGGVINRVLNLPLAGSVPGGIMLMPIKTDQTLDVPQMFAGGGDYDPIAVTPSGNFLYAADLTTNHLAAFSIASSNGALTAIGPQGPPVGLQVGPDPFNVVVDPLGKFVFVANCHCRTNPDSQGSVSVFSIDTGTGVLTPVHSPFLLGGGGAQPSALAVSSDSKFLFVASLDDMVYVENIAADGTLTPAANSPVPLSPGSTPVSIAVSVDGGNTVYTGNAGNGTISFFLNCVQSTLPTGCTGTPLPLIFQNNSAVGGTPGGAGVIVPDPTITAATSTTIKTGPGHFLYVTDYAHNTIVAFAVTSTNSCTAPPCTPIPGTITQSGSAVVTGGGNPFGLAFVP